LLQSASSSEQAFVNRFLLAFVAMALMDQLCSQGIETRKGFGRYQRLRGCLPLSVYCGH
jgi:hypothetical protein